MNKIIPMIALLFISLYALNRLHFQPEAPEFIRWKSEYKVQFQTQTEEFYRRHIFQANFKKIDQHNANPTNTYTIAVNQFSIYSQAQFVQRFLNSYQDGFNKAHRTLKSESVQKVIVDWTQKGAVGPVKNQGACGSASSFGTIGGMEGLNFVSTGKFVAFSEQQLIDCVYGCAGGFATAGYKYYETHGACTAAEYPYSGKPQTCKTISCPFKISKYIEVNSCSGLANAIQLGPVSVAVDASKWSSYASGIFSNCRTSLNHMVLLTASADEYWKCKNSWGAAWGERGYIRLAPNNTCGICSSALYPVK